MNTYIFAVEDEDKGKPRRRLVEVQTEGDDARAKEMLTEVYGAAIVITPQPNQEGKYNV